MLVRRRGAIALLALSCAACSVDTSGTKPVDGAARRDGGAVSDGGGRDAFGGDDSGGRRDGGEPDFRDLDWTAPVQVLETADALRCETDAVLTSDMRWLFLSRPQLTTGSCLLSRRFHVFEWLDGHPVWRAELPPFDPTVMEEGNPHPLDGRYAGMPGWMLFFHSATFVDGNVDLRWATFIDGDPPMPSGGLSSSSLNTGAIEDMPALSLRGDRLVFSRAATPVAEDIWEAYGTPPNLWGVVRRLDAVSTTDARDIDPALSPDGRVLVFERILNGMSDGDLFVARRVELTEPFSEPSPLDLVNTAETESDPFIAANGDLLFSRWIGGRARVFIARAAAR